MDIIEIFRVGLINLSLHPLRSLLTVLGIIFGVGAVVAMLSIGEGARYQTQQQIKSLGIENIRVRSRKPTVETKTRDTNARRFSIMQYGIKSKEYKHLVEILQYLKTSAPVRDVRQRAFYKDRKLDSGVMATTETYTEVTGTRIERGRFITALDNELLNRICVIGATARRELFSYRNPLGERIQIGSKWYEVVGLMEQKSVATGGMVNVRDVNKDIYIPLQTALVDFGTVTPENEIGSNQMVDVELDEIYLRFESADYIEYANAAVTNYLTRQHPLKDFEIEVPKELLKQAEEAQRIFDIVMVSIASISLLVGGIGIMNIMLASVTERTREIGIRRAVGAQRSDILMQFLFETVLLAVVGGLLGVIIGAGGAWAIVHFAKWKAIVTWYSVLLSFGISALVGVIFGMYPAMKAAKLSVIEALRYE